MHDVFYCNYFLLEANLLSPLSPVSPTHPLVQFRVSVLWQFRFSFLPDLDPGSLYITELKALFHCSVPKKSWLSQIFCDVWGYSILFVEIILAWTESSSLCSELHLVVSVEVVLCSFSPRESQSWRQCWRSLFCTSAAVWKACCSLSCTWFNI